MKVLVLQGKSNSVYCIHSIFSQCVKPANRLPAFGGALQIRREALSMASLTEFAVHFSPNMLCSSKSREPVRRLTVYVHMLLLGSINFLIGLSGTCT